MNDETKTVEAEVVTPDSKDAILAQQTQFKAMLEQVKQDMVKHQQAFETLKTRGIKLEGALESLDILLKSLSK